MNARHLEIIHLINEHKRLTVSELAAHTGVSEVTIRSDLSYLEQQAHLKRVHGGAISVQTDDVNERLTIHFDVKQRLVAHAADLVLPGETVLIEGGSANALLAKALAQRGDVSIITPSAYIAHSLKNDHIDIILLGGVYQSQSESLVGPLTKLCIENINFSTAFIGVDGFHQNTGFTSRDMMRADVVHAILKKKQRNIILTDASKFGKICPTTLGKIDDFTTVITNQGIPEVDITWLQSQKLKLILV
ncbi:DeoR/GlpR transcriptional regulator [Zooshikella marina]|uniref:DeoR/GlpR transcriptional regulator n=1 Tax=Zooshikella ganghwensis TaxID=202772 RepID=A0A4P9VRC4_9GAMM|nr:DNA-binding transcriptional regulator YciT [Zooshikella ganghwensis]MBU2704902.1 DeoR/GlpR transcriptional regulator [Zooshikella ganghwensis]RDH45339.1 DeoR/GlpR transcriptional regulator [Zooshikella ganghwensis]